MSRWAAGFGLLGVLAALLAGFTGEAPLDDLIRSALVWGAAFAVLGLVVGSIVRVVLREAVPASAVSEEQRERERKADELSEVSMQSLLVRELGESAPALEMRAAHADKPESPKPAEKALP